MKIKRYFGRFYTFEGKLGWLPLHKALFVMLCGSPRDFMWIKQSQVKIVR